MEFRIRWNFRPPRPTSLVSKSLITKENLRKPFSHRSLELYGVYPLIKTQNKELFWSWRWKDAHAQVRLLDKALLDGCFACCILSIFKKKRLQFSIVISICRFPGYKFVLSAMALLNGLLRSTRLPWKSQRQLPLCKTSPNSSSPSDART